MDNLTYIDNILQNLHFIRPQWFYALIPLLILSALHLRNKKFSRSWQSIIDPRLLPHLLVGKSIKKSSATSILLLLTGTIVITALAGPAWEKRPQPVFKEQSALVIALDLSRSMDATDIKPSRLTRARLKITDILQKRKLGQTALLVYAADAYPVSPLTDDVATITALLPSLTTDLMPSQGSRVETAIELAVKLLANAGVQHGDILLVTDGINKKIVNSIEMLIDKHRLSILAVGSIDGAPIPQQTGGFIKNKQGAIVLPKLKLSALQAAAHYGNGVFHIISADDSDIESLSTLFTKNRFEAKKSTEKSTLKTDNWFEQGPWLLLIAIPLVLLSFRRGVLVIVVLILAQQPQTAYAESKLDILFYNKDQRAAKLLEQDNAKQAAELFNNPQWKASAYYKDKQYEKSIDSLKDVNTADAHYNKGNAYAMLGDTKKALTEYDAALTIDPNHEDAKFNKNEILKQKNKQDKNNKSKSEKKNTSESKDDKKQSPNKNSDSQNKNSKNSQQDSQNRSNSDSNKEPNNKSNKKSDTNKDKSKPSTKEQTNKETKPDNKQSNKNKVDKKEPSTAPSTKTAEQSKQDTQTEKITKQWLRRIPDDPGGLLRNKFKYQYQRQHKSTPTDNDW